MLTHRVDPFVAIVVIEWLQPTDLSKHIGGVLVEDARWRDVQISVVVMRVRFLCVVLSLGRVEKLDVLEGLGESVLQPVRVVEHEMDVGLTVRVGNTYTIYNIC